MQSVKNGHFHLKTAVRKPTLELQLVLRYKLQKPIWACLGMPDHAHLKLHDQFVALTDMKLRAKNQLYISISF